MLRRALYRNAERRQTLRQHIAKQALSVSTHDRTAHLQQQSGRPGLNGAQSAEIRH